MTSLFGSTKVKEAAPVAPTVNSEDVSRAAAEERKRRANAKGRASTILTSMDGEYNAPQTASTVLSGRLG